MPTAENLEKKAIKAARQENWSEAIKLNLSLLKIQPRNTATLNRLAWAYTKFGQVKKASSTYKKVLLVDKNNPIANKNLKRLPHVKNQKPASPETAAKKTPFLFLEESGKTKVVSLLRVASPSILNTLNCAEPVNLVPKKRFISVKDSRDRYLGILPDDLSFRLLKLIRGGNHYQAWIKGLGKKNLQIFIREVKKSPSQQNQLSFPPPANECPLPPLRRTTTINKEKPEMTPTGEDESSVFDSQG